MSVVHDEKQLVLGEMLLQGSWSFGSILIIIYHEYHEWSISPLLLLLLKSQLQVLENTLGTRGLDAGRIIVLGGVDDLSVVNGNGESASSAIGVGPADQLAESAVLIGHEQL